MAKPPLSLRAPLAMLGAAAGRITRGAGIGVGGLSPEVARALPDSKGGEEPKDLQRWRTELSTIFTTSLGESKLFFAADQWVRVKLLLETAGPVAVGTRAQIVPVLSGKGLLLTTDVQYEVYLPKGSRLYYAAESVNRISFTVEPIPWLDQISTEIRRVVGALGAAATAIVQGIRPSSAPPPMAPVPQRVTKLQRLTPMQPPGKMP